MKSPELTGDPVKLMAHRIARPGTVVTWLNHWSIQHADWEALSQMSYIGIDGTLLQILLHRDGLTVGRTSADLVLPRYFTDVLTPGSRIALIGAAPGVADRAAERIDGHTVRAWDGYEQLRTLRTNPTPLHDFDPDVIVLGLGAGLQDAVAIELHEKFPEAVICTAGGWIDQIATRNQYFPEWVHRLRLGWLWRIAHEPRRLIGRYTVDAVRALITKRRLVTQLTSIGITATTPGFEVQN